MAALAFAAGLVFGLGLIVSGMANPAKVLGFLDVAGLWDPSLAFVMIGAIAVSAAPFWFVKRRSVSLLGQEMRLPTRTPVDRRLVLGSLAFGVGWGIAGFCPGPAAVAIGMGSAKALLFALAMLAGMAVFEVMTRLRGRRWGDGAARP
jgi:uncharacterized protein